MRRLLTWTAGLVFLLFAAGLVEAQDATATATGTILSPTDLDQLLKPIALYPDPLLAEIFTAATLPSQIVMADRYVNNGGDINAADQQPWDPSVQALVHYPTVLKWLDDNLSWTTEVGQAFLNQQQDVMDSVQRLRSEAQAEGNLQSTPQENVVSDNGDVEIEPADPDVIYVPTYPWDTIYDSPGIYCGFGVGFPIGIWLGYDWDWRHHRIFSWGPGSPRPRDWWTRPAGQRVPPRGVAAWHPAPGIAHGIVRGPARGYGTDPFRAARVSVPSAPAPQVGVEAGRGLPGREAPPVAPGGVRVAPPREAAPVGRPPVETISRPPPAARAPEVSRPAFQSRPAPAFSAPAYSAPSGGGAFGGSESASEARASSARGAESRGVSGGGGGGGSARKR